MIIDYKSLVTRSVSLLEDYTDYTLESEDLFREIRVETGGRSRGFNSTWHLFARLRRLRTSRRARTNLPILDSILAPTFCQVLRLIETKGRAEYWRTGEKSVKYRSSPETNNWSRFLLGARTL